MTSSDRSLGEHIPLLRHVDADIQIAAAAEFIESVESHVDDSRGLQLTRAAKELMAEDGVLSRTAIRLATLCFDYCLSDDIRAYAGNIPRFTDAAAVYFRSDVYKTTFPESVIGAIAAKVGLIPQKLIVAAPRHLETHISVTSEAGMLTPELAYWLVDDQEERPEPPCGVARQELFAALLRCGINPLRVSDNPMSGLPKGEVPESTYRRRYRRRSRIGLLADEERLRQWYEKSERHWGRLLGGGDGTAALFSSGTAANEAVMLALKSIGAQRVHVSPNWYYENDHTARSIFEQSTDVANSDVLLVNLESTNYFRLDGVEDNPLSLIEQFVQSAIEQPGQQKYLVIDSTANPLVNLNELNIAKTPLNLILIKTVSITKHQDGGRNYFFGGAWTQSRRLDACIREQTERVGGELREPHIIHFPRPSSTTLRARRNSTMAASERLAQAMHEWSGWTMTPSSYHSFIYPSQALIDKIVEVGMTSASDLDDLVLSLNSKLSDAVAIAVARSGSQDIEVGDSFGLPQTRISTQGGQNSIQGVTFRLKIPRLCPGYHTSHADLERLIRELGQELNKIDI